MSEQEPLQSQEPQELQTALDEYALRQKFDEERSTAAWTLELPIERIVQDVKFQVRSGLHIPAVKAYRNRYQYGAYLPPIEVADVNGAYILIDGWHRLEALRLLQRPTVLARIRHLPSIEEAQWLGGEINSQHGLRLNKEERWKLFKLYLKTGRHFIPGKEKTIRWVKSYRQIGIDFGINHSTAEKLIKAADPKLWEALRARGAGQIERGNAGGLRMPTKLLPEDLVKRNLDNARNAFQGIKSPAKRGEAIARAEAVTTEMKEGKPWTPFQAIEDF